MAIISFSLVTVMFDSKEMLWGDIGYQSLGVKELKSERVYHVLSLIYSSSLV